jgi:hypothetical protein
MTPISDHEAGHAVAAYLIGREVALVTVCASKDSDGHMKGLIVTRRRRG